MGAVGSLMGIIVRLFFFFVLMYVLVRIMNRRNGKGTDES